MEKLIYKGTYSTMRSALAALSQNGSEGDAVLVGSTLYSYNADGDVLSVISYGCHYRGRYVSLQDVCNDYETGGVEGDFVSVGDIIYFWNADLQEWTSGTNDSTRTFDTETVDRNLHILGSVTIDGDLSVGGSADIPGTVADVLVEGESKKDNDRIVRLDGSTGGTAKSLGDLDLAEICSKNLIDINY